MRHTQNRGGGKGRNQHNVSRRICICLFLRSFERISVAILCQPLREFPATSVTTAIRITEDSLRQLSTHARRGARERSTSAAAAMVRSRQERRFSLFYGRRVTLRVPQQRLPRFLRERLVSRRSWGDKTAYCNHTVIAELCGARRNIFGVQIQNILVTQVKPATSC